MSESNVKISASPSGFHFILDEKNIWYIPHNWMPTKYYSIEVKGFEVFSMTAQDSALTQSISFLGIATHHFLEMFKDSHAFTEPVLLINPGGIIMVKIGTMEKERYDELIEKEKKSKEYRE